MVPNDVMAAVLANQTSDGVAVLEAWLRDGGDANARGRVPTMGMELVGMAVPTMSLLPLLSASAHTRAMAMVIRHGARIDEHDDAGGSPLLAAATYATARHLEAMAMLLDAHADVNICDARGQQPLYAACEAKNAAGARLLLSRRADVHHRGHDGSTALMAAIRQQSGDVSLLQALLTAGADVTDRDASDEDALAIAQRCANSAATMLLKGLSSGEGAAACGATLVGKHVQVRGLATRPELNGREGLVLSYEMRKGRYAVQLDGATGCMSLRPENIEEVQTPFALVGRRACVQGLQAKPQLNGCLGMVCEYSADRGRYLLALDDNEHGSVWVRPANVAAVDPSRDTPPAPKTAGELSLAAAEEKDTTDVREMQRQQKEARAKANADASPLFNAVRDQDAERVRALLAEGAEPDAGAFSPLQGTFSPLHLAAQNGSFELVQMLISAKATPRQNETGLSPLASAAFAMQLRMLDLLLEAGASVNEQACGDPQFIAGLPAGFVDGVRQMQGETLLLTALNSEHCRMSAEGQDDPDGSLDPGKDVRSASVGCGEFIRGLVERGASPNVPSPTHGMPLIKASFMGRADLIRVLLEAEADPNLKDARYCQPGIAPLSQAVSMAQVDIARLLLEHGAKVDERSAVLLMDTLLNGMSMGRRMLPLMLAASNANVAMCRTLLEARANPDGYDEDGQTTLQMVSSTDGSVRIAEAYEIAAELLTHGASVNYADAPAEPSRPDAHLHAMKGRSALFLAVGHTAEPDLVRLLLEHQADPNQPAHMGLTPLLNAAYNGGAVVCRMLIDAQADPMMMIEGPPGSTPTSPLLQAIEYGHEDVVSVLVGARPELVAQRVGGYLPIQVAMMGGPEGVSCAMRLLAAMQSAIGRVAMPPSMMYTMINLFSGPGNLPAEGGHPEHRGNIGLTPQQVDLLPTRTLGSDEGNEPAADRGQCAICMIEFAENDKLTVLPCAHEFHSACVCAWLQLAPTCPLCRASTGV